MPGVCGQQRRGDGPIPPHARAVFVKRSNPNYAQPWQTQVQRSAVGSAFVVDVQKRHILTNAHVVAHHITIHVRRPGHPKKWKASLLCEGKSCDLALLTVGAPHTRSLRHRPAPRRGLPGLGQR